VGAKTVVISPQPSNLTWAKGSVVTTNGPVEVSWKLEGDTITIIATGTDGTKLRFEPNESLSKLNIIYNGDKK